MNQPIIACPHCKAQVGLTEALIAPLIQATHRKIAEREHEVDRRESAIQSQRAELGRAVELAEQQLTARLETERAIGQSAGRTRAIGEVM